MLTPRSLLAAASASAALGGSALSLPKQLFAAELGSRGAFAWGAGRQRELRHHGDAARQEAADQAGLPAAEL